jgi:hypothetical protein
MFCRSEKRGDIFLEMQKAGHLAIGKAKEKTAEHYEQTQPALTLVNQEGHHEKVFLSGPRTAAGLRE